LTDDRFTKNLHCSTPLIQDEPGCDLPWVDAQLDQRGNAAHLRAPESGREIFAAFDPLGMGTEGFGEGDKVRVRQLGG
jgi:hypothetical protein